MTGRDDIPPAGYSTGDPRERPADLTAMQADDTLLDILGAGGTLGDASDELTRVWRRGVGRWMPSRSGSWWTPILRWR
jgi:hypothetical protein